MANIILADPSTEVGRAAACLLESLGHSVETARTGEEALDLVRGKSPDLVIVDARLSGFEGAALIEAIRALPYCRQPCIFFVAENSSPMAVRSALDAGADDYMIKPFDRDIVLFKLAQARARGRLVERHQAPRFVQDNANSWRFRAFGKAV
jgi:two-component system chemotaxis response regulator CheY